MFYAFLQALYDYPPTLPAINFFFTPHDYLTEEKIRNILYTAQEFMSEYSVRPDMQI